MRRVRFALLLLGAATLALVVLHGCSGETAASSESDSASAWVAFNPTAEELSSSDATVQARATLESFFDALAAGDDRLANSFMDPMYGISWKVDRLEVDYVKSTSDSWPSNDERTFAAPIRIWPGDGSITPGETLPWTWTLRRDGDGRWRITNYGAG